MSILSAKQTNRLDLMKIVSQLLSLALRITPSSLHTILHTFHRRSYQSRELPRKAVLVHEDDVYLNYFCIHNYFKNFTPTVLFSS